MPDQLPTGKISCFLCKGLLVVRKDDKSRVLDHLEVEHRVNFNLDFLLGASFLGADEVSAISEIIKQNMDNAENKDVIIKTEEPNDSDNSDEVYNNDIDNTPDQCEPLKLRDPIKQDILSSRKKKQCPEEIDDKKYKCRECGVFLNWKGLFQHLQRNHDYSTKHAINIVKNVKKIIMEGKKKSVSFVKISNHELKVEQTSGKDGDSVMINGKRPEEKGSMDVSAIKHELGENDDIFANVKKVEAIDNNESSFDKPMKEVYVEVMKLKAAEIDTVVNVLHPSVETGAFLENLKSKLLLDSDEEDEKPTETENTREEQDDAKDMLNKLNHQIDQSIEKTEGQWQCKVCGMKTIKRQKLRQHAEIHLQGFSHSCHICGKTAKTRHSLRCHVSMNHSRLSCNFCGKSGMKKWTLKTHKLKCRASE